MKSDNSPSVRVMVTTLGQQDLKEAPINLKLFCRIMMTPSIQKQMKFKNGYKFLSTNVMLNTIYNCVEHIFHKLNNFPQIDH